MKLSKDQASLEQIARVVKYAFLKKYDLTHDSNFLSRYQHSQGYGEYHDGQLASYIMANHFQSQLRDTKVKMAGVGYVATLPEYRGQGDIKRLMAEMLSDLRAGGYALSNLAPFSETFYRQFGYENTIYQQVLTMNEHSLRYFKPLKTGKVLRGTWQDAKLRQAVLQIYQTVLQGHERNTVSRENWWWDRLDSYYPDRHLAVYYDEDGQAQAYLFYRIVERQFIVQEFVYLTPNAARALLSLMAAHTGQDFTFKFILPEDSKLIDFFPEQIDLKIEELPYMMSRIIDFQKVLACQKVLTPGTFKIEVKGDNYCPENNGVYELTNNDGKLEVKKGSGRADYSGTLTAWTKVLLGHLSLADSVALGEIAQQSERELQFMPGHVSFYDYF